MASLPDSEPIVRLAIFLVGFATLTLLEVLAPRRLLERSRRKRWTSNLGLMVLYTAGLRLVAPLGAVGVALWAARNEWGLLNAIHAPSWLAVPLAVILLDLIVYGQHVAFHRVAWLWRLHRVHHADVGFDLTTGVRFHPLEIAGSAALKAAAVIVLGAPALAVLVFEVLLSATALFTHANLRAPLGLDRALRLLVVTPDMHRVHHSTIRAETDSNFGFNLSIWDRVFRTYVRQPRLGQSGVVFGLPAFREAREDRLDRLILQPFRDTPSSRDDARPD